MAAKDNIDDWCKFEAFDYNGKLALKGRSGHFLTRWGPHDLHVMAAKEGIDKYCLFVRGTGDIIPPTFEIISVSWDSDGSSIVQNPSVVAEDTFINGGSNLIEHVYDLNWSNKTSETSSWKHAWGFEFTYTYKTGIAASIVSSHEFQAKISYNGEVGGSSTVENEA